MNGLSIQLHHTVCLALRGLACAVFSLATVACKLVQASRNEGEAAGDAWTPPSEVRRLLASYAGVLPVPVWERKARILTTHRRARQRTSVHLRRRMQRRALHGPLDGLCRASPAPLPSVRSFRFGREFQP